MTQFDSRKVGGSVVGQKGAVHHRFLDAEQIRLIDDALVSLGEFGELRLVVENGRLRFGVPQKSFDADKVKPGHFRGETP